MSPLSTTEKNNYRPVSTLSSNLFEKVMFDKLQCIHFLCNQLSYLYYVWFSQGTLTKLTDEYGDTPLMKRKMWVWLPSICQRHLLLAKLKAYGLQEPVLQLRRSYFLFCMTINKELNAMIHTPTGHLYAVVSSG